MLDLYLHRGSFEIVLADEDAEQEPDRWCSHAACGQEFWQILSQWMWNLRLELGQHLSPTAMQTTEFAPVLQASQAPTVEQAPVTEQTPAVLYGPAQWARPSWTSGFPGSAFTLQPDGSLLCPADHPLYPQERRPERDGSYRLLYAARIRDCRCCRLRAQCQESLSTTKPRRVSAVFWPVTASQASASPPVQATPHPAPTMPEPAPRSPVLWGDWPRSQLRRRWMKVMRTETVFLSMGAPPPEAHTSLTDEHIITRAQRAHWRLSWQERFARNARPSSAPVLQLTIHGLPATFANVFGFGLVTGA